MTPPEVTSTQLRVLRKLADGEWHAGTRDSRGDTVLATVATVATALWRMGLVERDGASRTARPSNPGYRYCITPTGRSAL